MLSIWSTFKLQPGQFFCLFDNSRTSVLVFVFTFGFGPPLGLAGYFYVKVLSPISDTLARASTPPRPRIALFFLFLSLNLTLTLFLAPLSPSLRFSWC
mmetsp:Transcript_107115/g.311012  ORF Transcript_107115/g.311012 Transcript_107115/m.311012 type:complete len:98 (+) Transcript_107115:368-661(+)